MPVLARFYGLVVKMYFRQHEQNPPHIHILYGEYLGMIDLQTLEMMEGDLPSKALTLVREWTQMHREELIDIWNTQNFRQLPPLE